VIGHLGVMSVRTGLITAALLWLGLVITTVAVNNAYRGAKPMLTVIDGGHWLTVLLIMGLVIGLFGT
jgi:Protein of unknown function (DUF1761)